MIKTIPTWKKLSIIFMICLIFVGTANSAYSYTCRANPNLPEPKVFGISISSPTSQKAMGLLSELGAKWVRHEFRWSVIEESEGHYNWKEYDKFVKSMEIKEIKILATISYIPKWIKSDAETLKRLQIFTERLVKRYKPRGKLAKENNWSSYGITYWEIFNTPNFTGNGWMNKGDNAKDHIDLYASVLNITNYAIKKNYPRSFIVMGGLSSKGTPPKVFLDRLYEHKIHNCYDILALQPYNNLHNLKGIKKSTKNLFKAYNKSEKTIWFSEYGTEDDEKKSDLIDEAFRRSNEWDGLFWFNIRDTKRFGSNFGLVESDWSKKPPFITMQDNIKKYSVPLPTPNVK